jgi:hypothetical protein
MKYEGESFGDRDIHLDGNEYHHCHFERCRMIFHGKAPVVFTYCQLVNLNWQFVDAADLTVNFMRAMYHGTGDIGPHIIGQIFDLIKSPP